MTISRGSRLGCFAQSMSEGHLKFVQLTKLVRLGSSAAPWIRRARSGIEHRKQSSALLMRMVPSLSSLEVARRR
jgi:hypothetical protein